MSAVREAVRAMEEACRIDGAERFRFKVVLEETVADPVGKVWKKVDLWRFDGEVLTYDLRFRHQS